MRHLNRVVQSVVSSQSSQGSSHGSLGGLGRPYTNTCYARCNKEHECTKDYSWIGGDIVTDTVCEDLCVKHCQFVYDPPNTPSRGPVTLLGLDGLGGGGRKNPFVAMGQAPSCQPGYSYSPYPGPVGKCPEGHRWHKINAGSGMGGCFKCWPKSMYADNGGPIPNV